MYSTLSSPNSLQPRAGKEAELPVNGLSVGKCSTSSLATLAGEGGEESCP